MAFTGLSPYGGVSVNPFSQLQWQSPVQPPGAVTPYASQPLLQTQQTLQAAVQQLQQLLQLEHVQQQQLQQLQYIVQLIPAQLAQLHQQIQIAQQTQQPFVPGGITMAPLWSTSQIGAQPNYLM